MYIPFDQLPKSSRLWVYPATRALSTDEQQKVSRVFQNFMQSWQVHGKDLAASCDVLHDRFVVVAVDEEVNAPSGCSLDRLSAIVKELEEHLDLELLNRTQLAFLIDDQVKTVALADVPKQVSEGVITANTPFFDASIAQLAALERWPLAAQNSWLKRYF